MKETEDKLELKPFLCKFTAEQREWLRDEGHRTKTNSSEVVRSLVERAMRKEGKS